MSPRARELIDRLSLQPHPEGGFFAEVHRSTLRVDCTDGRPARAALTAIYYLLADQGTSRWHRVRSDEVWCHLEGAPIWLHQFDAATNTLGSSLLAPVGEHSLPQRTVAASVWQAACCQGSHSLVACLVAPGFDFADFTLMSADAGLSAWMRKHHPALAALV